MRRRFGGTASHAWNADAALALRRHPPAGELAARRFAARAYSGNSLPGFITPRGSSTALMPRMASISAALRE